MRRILALIVATGLAASVVALASPAGAQTGNLSAFCAAREEANSAQTKAENTAVIQKIFDAAPAAAIPAITLIRDGFAKKGDKFFQSGPGTAALAQLDGYVYDNCPGVKVPVTAIDYEFDGVPATLAAGPTNFKLTNNAPKEDHEMAIMRVLPAGESIDPLKILALPDKKAGKYVDFSKSAFMYAPAGQSGYTPLTLEPGKYIYACFLPQGGKKDGKPHFTLGMNGSFTVQ